ncbi:hypothetical protein PpBr36_03808 [Pyricularia pennisetigena]|uniref:hypothetical protein n=1 Tax=Pyricularia pennisetigena TaxID=1578925 RepID=UPI00114F8A63|nr:hypothetical protein PpBr36_03808 [Pyricularia pennisetigena]TLS30234.1 hypothetical protein PpBr36_03808 [Pyricularia pennisetigena]
MQFSILAVLAFWAQIPAILAATTCRCTGSNTVQDITNETTKSCCAKTTFNKVGVLQGKFVDNKCDYSAVAAFKQVSVGAPSGGNCV